MTKFENYNHKRCWSWKTFSFNETFKAPSICKFKVYPDLCNL